MKWFNKKPDFTPRKDTPAIVPPVAKITPAIEPTPVVLPRIEPWTPPFQEPAPFQEPMPAPSLLQRAALPQSPVREPAPTPAK